MFWYETVLKAIFVTKFWWIPSGNSWIDWYLWSASLLGILGVLFFWIKHLYHYRIRGLIVIFYYTLTAIVAFFAGIYLGIVVLVVAIVLLVLYVGGSLLKEVGQASHVGGRKISVRDREQAESDSYWSAKREREFWEKQKSNKDS